MSTLHKLERQSNRDLAQADYWARTRSVIIERWVNDLDPSTIIDIGCGSGYLADRLASPDRTVVGIDNDEQSIDVASSRDSNADFFEEDILNADIIGPFDCAICADVLEHFDDPEPVISAISKLLTTKGNLIVSVPNHPWLYGPHDDRQGHARRYSISCLTEALDADFEPQTHAYTNALPLAPYAITQRLLGRDVPSAARGEHSPTLEFMKDRAVWLETNLRWPFGITLLAQFEKRWK